MQWLWKVFSSTGKVEDIYMSKKVRRNNPLKFAFIRYRTKEEIRRTIERLNGWIVWGCRMSLTELRYRRFGGKGKGDRKVTNGKMGETQQMGVEAPENQDTRGYKGNSGSYKEALLKDKETEIGRNLDKDNDTQTLGKLRTF
ncbi:hypothetical protein PIB30_053869 [Stylosanthes scabra]|uniref:RRM domain-containing protein n=1 Tax=Stylosanthes scabra TaxID=79078 RepID=A0ABU6RIM9_9FABA|nr:hypothetical protein [Stylosanthes scabra]